MNVRLLLADLLIRTSQNEGQQRLAKNAALKILYGTAEMRAGQHDHRVYDMIIDVMGKGPEKKNNELSWTKVEYDHLKR